MNSFYLHPPHRLTEKELEDESERLTKLILAHEATVVDANRLAEVNTALNRIRSVRHGKFWP